MICTQCKKEVESTIPIRVEVAYGNMTIQGSFKGWYCENCRSDFIEENALRRLAGKLWALQHMIEELEEKEDE